MQPQIVVPFDFSPASQRALAWAADLQRTAGGCPLHVIHIVVPKAVTAPGAAPPRLSAEEIEAIAKLLRGAVHRLEIAASIEVISSAAVPDAILASAAFLGAGLIVMGTQGTAGEHKGALGPVADRVVNDAICPVVLMGPVQMEDRPSRARR